MLTALLLQAAGWSLGQFSRDGLMEPILGPNPKSSFVCPIERKPVAWEHDHAFNPAAVARNGKVYLLYRAEDNSGSGIGGHTSRIGLADSSDGIHFNKRKVPVLFPSNDAEKRYEWPGGCEDPRIVQAPNGEYVLTYTAWNRKLARLSVAMSKDLVHWRKLGPAFGSTRFRDTWSKSGAIVTRLEHDHPVAAKIAGKYWMYWGDGIIHIAESKDLIHWVPEVHSGTALLDVLTPRQGKFDSLLVESGPPPVLTRNGIVLIYNGENDVQKGDKALGDKTYAAGQALFDARHPDHLVRRGDTYFMKPELPSEKTGQYEAGTVFTEGLVRFKGKWFLYYGAADSFVGVAATR